ncbi:peptide deformylase [Sphingopyxis flava]|uniref:Peptide deformylase n=1 Tax=Sphingopyxis flava TaxID=1507287 RepID=A0A1T4ZWX3_9SPHN|nr:peptide deformylase [Sphingopyxis flava]SKB26863.1 peptide deformylase [Sphingopyxis flava]
MEISLSSLKAAHAILMDGAPFLRQRSVEIEKFDDDLAALVRHMIEIVQARRARGLAAIQIGVPVRVIVATADGKGLAMVNPVITRTLNRFAVEMEGCLSVPPSQWRKVSRPAKCEIEWQDIIGNRHAEGFSGAWARVLQHEIDHLDGTLITDREPA